jgi:hypothetical protein
MSGQAPRQYRDVPARLLARVRRRSALPAWALATAGFVIAFVIVTWPLTPRFNHATFGGPGDGWALIWQTRFRLENGVSYFSPTFSLDVGWPVGTEYVSSLLLSTAAVELPNMLLLLLGFSDVSAYNLVVLLAAVGSSLAMYALLRRLGCRPSVAFWGGLAYLLAPWHLEKLAIHPTLASMAALPLLVLGMLEFARRPNLRSGALIVGAFALATFTHSYYAVGTAATLVACLPIVLVAAHRRGILPPLAKRLPPLALGLLLVLAPIALAMKLQEGAVESQLDRPLYDAVFAARPYLWLLPSPDNPLFGEAAREYVADRALPPNQGELALYLGFATLALAGLGVVAALRGTAPKLGAALGTAMALVGVALSAPRVVDLPLLGETTMLIAYVNDVLGFVSTPARFVAFTLTGVVVLAALGLEWIAGQWRRLALVPVAAACLLSAVELPIHRDGMVADTRPPELVHVIDREVGESEAVAQYPSMSRDFLPIANQLFYQLAHKRPLLNGATVGSVEDAVRNSVENRDDPSLGSKLALLGFHWATYDSAQAVYSGIDPVTAQHYAPPAGLQVVRRLADGSALMRVTAEPAGALAAVATGFERVEGWMTHSRATILVCATSAGLHRIRFDAIGFAEPRRFWFAGRAFFTVDPSGRPNPVRVRLRLRRGWQLLPLELIGSKPTRPSDVLPGSTDTRTLVMTVGAVEVDGPVGDPRACRSQLAERDELELAGTATGD